MDRGTWWTAVHGVTKEPDTTEHTHKASRKRLGRLSYRYLDTKMRDSQYKSLKVGTPCSVSSRSSKGVRVMVSE